MKAFVKALLGTSALIVAGALVLKLLGVERAEAMNTLAFALAFTALVDALQLRQELKGQCRQEGSERCHCRLAKEATCRPAGSEEDALR